MWKQMQALLADQGPISAAASLLVQLGIETVPVPLADIATALGVELVPIDSPGVEGLLQFSGGMPQILFSVQSMPVRRRFTVAHELGHLLLHARGVTRDAVYFRTPSRPSALPPELRDSPRPSLKSLDPREREANKFAADLLMPPHIVTRLLLEGKSESEIALRLNVSQEAIQRQIATLR